MERYGIGSDVAGTFTDLVAVGEGPPPSLKVSTCPDAQVASVHERQPGSCRTSAMERALSPMFLDFSAIGRYSPVRGIDGGKDGAPTAGCSRSGWESEREEPGLGFQVNLLADSRWFWQLGGGHGWGNPPERAPQAARDDVLDGYASAEGAQSDDGLALDDKGRALDAAPTRVERAQHKGGAS